MTLTSMLNDKLKYDPYFPLPKDGSLVACYDMRTVTGDVYTFNFRSGNPGGAALTSADVGVTHNGFVHIKMISSGSNQTDGFAFNVANKMVSGDFDVSMRITYVNEGDSSTRGWLSLQEADVAGPFMLEFSGGKAVTMNMNSTSTSTWTVGASTFTNGTQTAINAGSFGNPIYVRITRVGDVITFYTSADSVTWAQLAQTTFKMKPDLYISLFSNENNGNRISHYDFDYLNFGLNRTLKDLVGANHATIQNNLIEREVLADDGMVLNGTNQSIRLPDLYPSTTPTEFSIEVECRKDLVGSNVAVIGNYNSFVNYLYISSAPAFNFEVYDGVTKNVNFTPVGFGTESTTFRTFTVILTSKNSDKLRAYIDGRCVGEAAVGTMTDPGAPIVGARLDGIWNFKGKVRRVRFWNRVLSPEEIRTIQSYTSTSTYTWPIDKEQYCCSLTGPIHAWLDGAQTTGSSRIDIIHPPNLPSPIHAKSAIRLTHGSSGDNIYLKFTEYPRLLEGSTKYVLKMDLYQDSISSMTLFDNTSALVMDSPTYFSSFPTFTLPQGVVKTFTHNFNIGNSIIFWFKERIGHIDFRNATAGRIYYVFNIRFEPA